MGAQGHGQEGLDQQRHTGFLILLVNAVVLVAIAAQEVFTDRTQMLSVWVFYLGQ